MPSDQKRGAVVFPFAETDSSMRTVLTAETRRPTKWCDVSNRAPASITWAADSVPRCVVLITPFVRWPTTCANSAHHRPLAPTTLHRTIKMSITVRRWSMSLDAGSETIRSHTRRVDTRRKRGAVTRTELLAHENLLRSSPKLTKLFGLWLACMFDTFVVGNPWASTLAQHTLHSSTTYHRYRQ